MTNEEFAALSADVHRDIFGQLCTAFWINTDGGYTKSADLTRRQMEAVLSFGKISAMEAAEISGDKRGRVLLLQAWLKESLGVSF